MIMKRGQPLLLPVAPGFIWLSLLLSLVLDMLVRMKWPELAWLPGACARCLLFWNMHQPYRVGVGTAIFLGLLFVLAADQKELGAIDEHLADQLMQSALASLGTSTNLTAHVGGHYG